MSQPNPPPPPLQTPAPPPLLIHPSPPPQRHADPCTVSGLILALLMTSADIASPSTRVKLALDDNCAGDTTVLGTQPVLWAAAVPKVEFPQWPAPYHDRVSVCLSSNYETPQPSGEVWTVLPITSGTLNGHGNTHFRLWPRPTTQVNLSTAPTSDTYRVDSPFYIVCTLLDERGIPTVHETHQVRPWAAKGV